jgi:uncharacterized phage-associated protein
MHNLSNAKNVARWFINRADRSAGEAITQLKVQKLVFYSDAWHLAYFDRQLIPESFQAWAHGPVVTALYAKYRASSWDSLPVEKGPLPVSGTQEFLESIYEAYGQFSAKKLEAMTHNELPWIEARNGLPPEAKSDTVISKLTMRNFYAKRIKKAEVQTIQD